MSGREKEGRVPSAPGYSAQPEPVPVSAQGASIPSRGPADDAALDRRTREIAKAHGCDRGTFTVCWGEHERGEVCRCKEDARAELALAGEAGTAETEGLRSRARGPEGATPSPLPPTQTNPDPSPVSKE